MTVDITWSISGIDARYWEVQKSGGGLWRLPQTVRGSVYTLPGQHGVRVAGLPVYDEPQLPLVLRARNDQATTVMSDQAALELMTNELLIRLGDPNLTIERSSGGLVTSAPARLISFSPGRFVPGQRAEFTVILGIPGVFLRGAEVDHVEAATGAFAVDTLRGMTAPVGDALLRFKNPQGLGPRLSDTYSDTSIWWNGTMPGWYLYVDVGALRAWLTQDPDRWSGAPSATETIENLVPNPSFEVDVANIVTSSGIASVARTSTSEAVRNGSWALIATTAASPTATTRVGQTLDVGAISEGDWLAVATPARGRGTPMRFRSRIQWTGGPSFGAYSAYTPWDLGDYHVAIVSEQAPAGNTGAVAHLYAHDSGSDTPPASATFDSDAWVAAVAPTQAEAEAAVAGYFDGDSDDEAWSQHDWTGTPHDSSSILTVDPAAATSGLDYSAKGPLQFWPEPQSSVPTASTLEASDVRAFGSNHDEVVIRAKPAYL